jgi:hypothetical protein
MKPGDFYRHYKGTVYKILVLARNSDSELPMIVYQDTTAPEKIWARDLDVWSGDVEWNGKTVKRFTAL